MTDHTPATCTAVDCYACDAIEDGDCPDCAHAITVVDHAQGRPSWHPGKYRASCSCGWVSNTDPNYCGAVALGDIHLKEHA